MTDFDVIIVGARIAGASLALQMARQGYKVALLDRDPRGSNTLSTHFLWPRGVSYLWRLGLGAELDALLPGRSRVHYVLDGIGIVGRVPVAATSGRLRAVHGSAVGAGADYACIRRQTLDALLVDAAVAAGATPIERAEVTRLTIDGDGRVRGVQGKRRGHAFSLSARFFVGADGRDSTLARLVKAPTEEYRAVCTSTCWSYFSGVAPHDVVLAKTGRRGFGAATASDGRTMVLVWGPQEDAARYLAMHDRQFQQCVAETAPAATVERLRRAVREEPFYRAVGLHALKRQSVVHNVLLAGDAACFKDQCTASGITHALRDSELAAAALSACLDGRETESEALTRYAARRTADMHAYFEMACQAAMMHPAKADEKERMRALQHDQDGADAFISLCADSAVADAAKPRLSTKGASDDDRGAAGAAANDL